MLKVNSRSFGGSQQESYKPVPVTVPLTGDPIENLARETLKMLKLFSDVARYNSYIKSSIFRYLEEALAETVAQVSVNGLREVMAGITFPVKKRLCNFG